jgi:hypothetical protein
VGVLGNLGGHVVSNLGVKAGDQHQGLVEELVDLLLVGLNSDNTVVLEGLHGIGKDGGRVEKVADKDGLEDVKLEVSHRSGNGDSGVVTHDLGADHGKGFTLGGVDLSGHDGRTGLVLGEVQLSETTTGTGSEETDVVSDLHEGDGKGVKSSGSLNNGIVGSEGLELVGGGDEVNSGELGNLVGNGNIESLLGVKSGSDSGSSLSQHLKAGKGGLDTLDTVGELGSVSGELLTKGQGGSILQVGTSNLDDVVESKDLLLESGVEGAEGRKELLGELHGGSNVHDGGEGVVGGSGHVNVVVGVDGLLGSHLSSENLNSTVGDNLVGVHVGLGSGTGLPDDEGEVVGELSGDNLIGSLLNGLSELGVESKLHVHGGSGALEDTEGLDDRGGHAVEGLVNLEVGEGAANSVSIAISNSTSENHTAESAHPSNGQ